LPNKFEEAIRLETGLLLEYAWVLVVLVGMEGLLAADNALVLAIMVKHLPDSCRKKALFYGLLGALILRFSSLFVISYLVNVWEVQAIGAMYLLYISIHNIYKKFTHHQEQAEEEAEKKSVEEAVPDTISRSAFWLTVCKVEIADLAFAVDSILAAVALAVSLPGTSLGHIGGMDTAQFIVVLSGGFIGLVIMRFAASMFVELLKRRPGLEIAAFVIVGWVGIKLVIHTLAHQAIGILPHSFAESMEWKIIFYAVLLLIALCGWFMSKEKEPLPVKEK